MPPKDHLNPTELANKAKGYARAHPDQARNLVDKLESALNSATRGRFSGIIDKGSSAVQKQLGIPGDRGGEAPWPPDPDSPDPEPPSGPVPDPEAPEPGDPSTPSEPDGPLEGPPRQDPRE